MAQASSGNILILTQGHAGDRLGARLAPALRQCLPQYELVGLGGAGMQAQGVRILANTAGISAMGYSGLLPALPKALRAAALALYRTRRDPPQCVIAVDVWQPLGVLHRFGEHLRAAPHVCYLPPAPNFIGHSRVHDAVARTFHAVVTPFPHQARLYGAAGGNVHLAAHAGLQTCREETVALTVEAREPLLALLPGSRALEVSYSLPVQYAAAKRIMERYPELTPVVCCADEGVERLARRTFPGLACSRNAREVLGRARFGIICSGTAALEAAILGCPGVVTYHGPPTQQWEWHRVHLPKLERLRTAGVASPYISLPNILARAELYPEMLDVPVEAIVEAGLRGLAEDPHAKRKALDGVAETLSWEDAGTVVAGLAAKLVS